MCNYGTVGRPANDRHTLPTPRTKSKKELDTGGGDALTGELAKGWVGLGDVRLPEVMERGALLLSRGEDVRAAAAATAAGASYIRVFCLFLVVRYVCWSGQIEVNYTRICKMRWWCVVSLYESSFALGCIYLHDGGRSVPRRALPKVRGTIFFTPCAATAIPRSPGQSQWHLPRGKT